MLSIVKDVVVAPYAPRMHRKPNPHDWIVLAPLTFAQAAALNPGDHVYVLGLGGRALSVKINGRPRRWKRDPDRLELPIKYGLYEHDTIEHNSYGWRAHQPYEVLHCIDCGVCPDFLPLCPVCGKEGKASPNDRTALDRPIVRPCGDACTDEQLYGLVGWSDKDGQDDILCPECVEKRKDAEFEAMIAREEAKKEGC